MKLWPNSTFFKVNRLDPGPSMAGFRSFNSPGAFHWSSGERNSCSAPPLANHCALPNVAAQDSLTHPRIVPHFRPRPLTCLADMAELAAGNVSRFAAEMPADIGHRLNLRKWWEWNYLARCAEELGVLNDKSVAIGLGVGNEPLIFYFANHCRQVIATDLYGSDTNWIESRFEHAESVYRTAPVPFPRERVEIRNADMRALGVPDASVDFAWSCSSIEHVPTLQDLLALYTELARVLKVGGHALLTTEYCLTEPPYLLPGVNAMDAGLLGAFADVLGAFEFVGVTDLSFNFAYPDNAPRQRRYHPAEQAAILVGLSAVTPVGFVLKRRNGSVGKWPDLKISPDVRTYSECAGRIQTRDAQAAQEVVERLRPLVKDGPDRLPVQLYHHVFRTYLEGMVHDGAHTEQGLVDEILEFLPHLPKGAVHDADCLDLMGHLLHNASHYEEAANLYWLSINSPSTCQAHVIENIFDYCRIMKRMGRYGEAVDGVVPVLRDLMISGVMPREVSRPLASGAKRSGLSADDIRYLQHAFSDCMSHSITTFWNEVATCTASLDGLPL